MPAWVSEQAVPENGSRDFSRYYYSFDYGEVHFIVLNSQWDETEAFKSGLLAEQLEWLREDASCSRKKWKIVLIHKDVLQYRIHNRPERQEGISRISGGTARALSISLRGWQAMSAIQACGLTMSWMR